MATTPPRFSSPFLNKDADKKESSTESRFDSKLTANAAEKPTSLYKPRQSPSFGGAAGQDRPFANFGQDKTSPFGRSTLGTDAPRPSFARTTPAADAARPSFTRTMPGADAARPTFGRTTPAAQTGTSPFGSGLNAGQTARPFTSLRQSTALQGQSMPASQRFARPGLTPTGATTGAAAGVRPTFQRPQTDMTRPAAPAPTFRTPGAVPAPPTFRSSSPFRKDVQISDEEFLLLRDFIYQQCGIFIAENRKYLVENRLANRIKELNLKSYSDYYNFLRFDASRNQELTKLYEAVTTNETSFYRNPPQLEVFQNSVVPDALEICRKAGHKRLRIWSAGCSTGEEPYTLGIILHEVLRSDIKNWDIKITANDLSAAVLAAARNGIYSEYALRTTPREIVSRYFKQEGNTYRIDPDVKRLVSFGPINLNDKDQVKRVEKSQIVFCRNVIIYFDDDMKRRVINAFYDNLEPQGMLLIGHSESLHNISRAFQLEHHKGTIVYRKMA